MSEWNFIPIRWVLSATKDDRFDTFTEAMLAATKALFVGCAKALGVNATGNKLAIRERLLDWAGKVQSKLQARYK